MIALCASYPLPTIKIYSSKLPIRWFLPICLKNVENEIKILLYKHKIDTNAGHPPGHGISYQKKLVQKPEDSEEDQYLIG